MNLNKLFLRWIAVFGLVAILSVNGWGAIAYRSATSANTTTGNLTINKPAGVVGGDVMIASIAIRPDTATVAAPAGWTIVRTTTSSGKNKLIVYYKAAGGSEPASYTWTMGNSPAYSVGGILAFSGVDTSSPIIVDNGQTNSNQNSATPSINVTVNNAMIVTSHEHHSAYLWIPPAGMTERVDVRSPTSNNGTGIDLEMNTVSQAAAGMSGVKTATAGDSDDGAAHILALRPLVGPTLSISDSSTTEGDSGTKILNFTVTLTSGTNVTVDFNTSSGTAIAENDFNTTNDTLTFASAGSQIISVPILGDTTIEPNETFTVTLSNATGGAIITTTSAIGTILNDDSYCKGHGLATGFHIIDPDGGSSTNSFEIFCSSDTPQKDLIALPNKNSSNNFLFNSNVLTSTNYYTEATTNSTEFNAIEINPLTMQVITSGVLTPTASGDGTYKIMGKGFSNINLIGSPFAIDWDNTSISECNTAKLTRKGYYGQAVKINSLDYDNKAQCQIDSMKLKLLSDYTYLIYEGTEVLQKTCKEMAEAVPTDFLDSATVKGHYWISPNENTRSHNATLITAEDRPMVAYCWYQTDLDYVWTFFLALDGKVTNNKNDLVSRADTCSEKGLWPFVPNNESTFDRVRGFLSDKKTEWVNYTGTNNEKFKAFNNNSNYYLGTEYDGPIWPYGSFGVYFPYNGNNDMNGVYKKWGGASNSTTGWMSGSPMHNVSTISTDYPRKDNDSGVNTRDYYSWGNYSNTDTLSSGNYAYADTMGAKGWRSVLSDLNKTNEWFISRSGAGDNFDSTGNYPYYEPNGNYTGGAWLNFLYDDLGRVRHNDDLDAKYPYYDYMCMAEDNYDFTTRYGLVKGPFNVIEHDAVLSGTQYKDATLATKIVNNTMQFDVVLLRNDLSDIRADYDISGGIFLNDTVIVGSSEIARDLHYFGQISDFNQTRFELPASRWPFGVETWSKAKSRLFFKIKYCSVDTMKWTDCWTLNDNTATCKSGQESYCKSADSNDFAVRPKTFSTLLATGSPIKAGDLFTMSFLALDNNDIHAFDYNETVGQSFDVDIKEHIPGCKIGAFKESMISGWAFADGNKMFVDNNYSEVGQLDINVTEGLKACQARFAAVDCNDTALSDLSIGDGIATLIFTPDHFDLNAVFSNKGNGFTYISSDLNMSADLNVTVTAKGMEGITTQNYNKDCYAKNTDYIVSYGLNPSPLGSLNNVLLIETYSGKSATNAISPDFNLSNVSKAIFTTDINGSAKLDIKLNFDRGETVRVNPFSMSVTAIDVNDTDNVVGNATLNQQAYYVYGRITPRDVRVFGNDPFTANAWYEVFNTPVLAGTALTPSRNTPQWFINTLHNDNNDGDGNITRLQNNLAVTTVNIDGNGVNGMETYNFNAVGAANIPYSRKAHINTDPWLWFGTNALNYSDPSNANLDCQTHPCFNINVVPDIGRAGSATATDQQNQKANKATSPTGVTYDYTPATR